MIARRLRLGGKVALVTGAGSSAPGVGSGKAMSFLFAREGAKVLLVDRYDERARETLEMVQADGGEASIFVADVTKESECQAAAAAAVERFGRLDTLVNNIGITRPAGAADLQESEWDDLQNVNLKAMVLMSKHAIPHLRAAGGASIISIASTGAIRPPGGHFAYDTQKGAVISLTIGLAIEEGRHGIRANCIMPGRMVTPMVTGRLEGSGRTEQQFRDSSARNILGREGTAWDIAWAAVFLASDEARWITGTTLPVEGGYLHTPLDFAYFRAEHDPDNRPSGVKL